MVVLVIVNVDVIAKSIEDSNDAFDLFEIVPQTIELNINKRKTNSMFAIVQHTMA